MVRSFWLLLCFFIILPLHCFILLAWYSVKNIGKKTMYISGAISYDLAHYKEKFYKRERELRNIGLGVINPARNVAPPFMGDTAAWLYYMALSVIGLWCADKMLFVGKDYTSSGGVRVEIILMQRLGKWL